MKLLPESKCIKDTYFSTDPSKPDEVNLTTFENCAEVKAMTKLYTYTFDAADKKYEFKQVNGKDTQFDTNVIK